MKATLNKTIGKYWKKGDVVYLNGLHFCKINGSCLEASLIYESAAWDISDRDSGTEYPNGDDRP